MNKSLVVLFLLNGDFNNDFNIYNFFKFRKKSYIKYNQLLNVDKYFVFDIKNQSKYIFDSGFNENILYIFYNKRLYYLNFFDINKNLNWKKKYLNFYLLKLFYFFFNKVKILKFIWYLKKKNAYI